jgi:hypothetical protein
MAKSIGSGDRVNAAFVHGKFTFLSGEICVARDRRFMRAIPERSIRLTNDQACPFATKWSLTRFYDPEEVYRLVVIFVNK